MPERRDGAGRRHCARAKERPRPASYPGIPFTAKWDVPSLVPGALGFGRGPMALSRGWQASRSQWYLQKACTCAAFSLFLGDRGPWRGAGSPVDAEVKKFLEKNTEVTSTGSLTPEIQLRLLTPRCKFWWERADLWPYGDPYWAIYWPGGQALSRYLLDNPGVVRGKSVLDLGSGCGATAVAAKMSGASYVVANDTDPIAGMAIALNCELNRLNPFPILTEDILDMEQEKWDLVVLGDMFYDDDLADRLHQWLRTCSGTYGTRVLIGDPGRPQFTGHRIQQQLCKIVEFSLPEPTRQDNSGLTTSAVWEFWP